MVNSLGSILMDRVFLLILHVLLLGKSCGAKKNHLCTTSSCGGIHNIRHPFRLKGDPKGCGRSNFELICENNRTVLYWNTGRYYVKSIHYSSYDGEDYVEGSITVVDDGLQKGNCSSLPHFSVDMYASSSPFYIDSAPLVAFVKCSQPVASISYIDTKPCIEGAYSADAPSNFSRMKVYSYAVYGYNQAILDIKDSCTITMMAWTQNYNWGRERNQYYHASLTYMDLHNRMSEGFSLLYQAENKHRQFAICFLDFKYEGVDCTGNYKGFMWATANLLLRVALSLPVAFVKFIEAKFILGAPCILIFLIYKWMRRHRAMDENIEEFLQAHNNFMPIRYSYSDIKKITRNFKHKLGEGGYGSVYKGILRSGNEVAIKILNKSKSNGQDFISEVATIGRIHHVNVVQLVGFCFDYSKQALVYDFMPNGSLDKHISYKDSDDSLDYKKMYDISLGIARGIEYLHRGCDIQILHFDIKPHNILLDQNLTPKVSDFGLARLYPVDHNIVSLTAARGTLGYMAPELFYRDIGGVSYKADVYSFGMLLMEMAGRRRNVKANVTHSSQIYFPLWVYDQLSKENEVEIEEAEGEREITRKMIIVALWCIQLIPNDRPSMSRVLNMLEGDIGQLRLPPKPLLYPSEKPVDDVNIEIELESFSTTSSAPTISKGYQFQNSNEITESCIV